MNTRPTFPFLIASESSSSHTEVLVDSALSLRNEAHDRRQSVFYLTSRRLLALQIDHFFEKKGLKGYQAFTYFELLRKINSLNESAPYDDAILNKKSAQERLEVWMRNSVAGIFFDQSEMSLEVFLRWSNLVPTGVPWAGSYSCITDAPSRELEILRESVMAEFIEQNSATVSQPYRINYEDKSIRNSLEDALHAPNNTRAHSLDWPVIVSLSPRLTRAHEQNVRETLNAVCGIKGKKVLNYSHKRGRALKINEAPFLTIASEEESSGFLASKRILVDEKSASGEVASIVPRLGRLTEKFLRSIPRPQLKKLRFFYSENEVIPVNFSFDGAFADWNIEARVGAGLRRFHPVDLHVDRNSLPQPGLDALLSGD